MRARRSRRRRSTTRRFRDDLIALGLDPRTGETSGQRSALSRRRRPATPPTTCSTRSEATSPACTSNRPAASSGVPTTTVEATGEGRVYQKLGNFAVIAVQARGGHDRGVRVTRRAGAVLTNGTFSAARRTFADGDVSKWRRSTTRGCRSGARSSRTSPRSCARRSGGSSRASPSWMAAWSGPTAAARCRMTPVGGMTSAPGCVTRRRSGRSASTSDISSIPFPGWS